MERTREEVLIIILGNTHVHIHTYIHTHIPQYSSCVASVAPRAGGWVNAM